MRHVLLLALFAALLAVLPAAAETTPPETEASLQPLLAQNLALAESVQATPPPAPLVTRVEDLALRGTKAARALVSAGPKRAEAHDLLGLFLSVAYRATPAPTASAQTAPTGSTPAPPSALRRAAADPAAAAEALKEITTAMQLQPKNAEFALDHAWALIAAGQKQSALAELRALPRRFPRLPQAAEARRLELQELALGQRVRPDAAPALPGPAPAQPVAPTRITWVPFADAFDTAQKESKLVLVDFRAEWCGWCRKMEAEVYPRPEVVALSRDFVFSQVDTDRDPRTAGAYGIRSLPTVVILDADGKERGRIGGYEPAAQFVKDVKAAASNTPR